MKRHRRDAPPTPSTRLHAIDASRELGGVAVWVLHPHIQSSRSRRRREMTVHPTHRLLCAQVLTTHDGRTIRYPPPAVKVHDVVKVDLESGKIVDSIKFDVGMTCMITKGRNTGRVGTIVNIEKHPGSFDIVAVRDASNHQFATRLSNIFVVGKDDDLQVTLPKGKGVKLSILEERKKRFKDKY